MEEYATNVNFGFELLPHSRLLPIIDYLNFS
jgi:hypothetical protein